MRLPLNPEKGRVRRPGTGGREHERPWRGYWELASCKGGLILLSPIRAPGDGGPGPVFTLLHPSFLMSDVSQASIATPDSPAATAPQSSHSWIPLINTDRGYKDRNLFL